MTAKLQVALDLPQGDRALKIAVEAAEGGADWIEAGTPLIKSEGLSILRRLREACPGKTIVADMKTMDVGAIEADMAARQGADVVVVMGLASDSTISESVEAAGKYGAKIMIDMMGITDIERRVKEVTALGASIICVHIAVDEQMSSGVSASLANRISHPMLELAVAGGITAGSAAELAKAGADIIIVGGAIAKSDDATRAARDIKKAIETGETEKSESYRRVGEDQIAEAFIKASTANICDAQHRHGAMRGLFPRSGKGVKMVGKALTVQTVNGDWAKPIEAIDVAQPGDVIVIDSGGGEIANWGELATRSAMNRGLSGVIVDGAIRDAEEISELIFPCYSRHVSPDAGEPKGFGGIGVQIKCGGIRVRTGDWIIGDSDGLVVVPAEKAVEVANRAMDVLEREIRIRKEIMEGSTLSKVLELEKWERR